MPAVGPGTNAFGIPFRNPPHFRASAAADVRFRTSASPRLSKLMRRGNPPLAVLLQGGFRLLDDALLANQ